jgi:hypothetical protein
MKYLLTLSFCFTLILFSGSCNKGPNGGIPFYMKMDTAVVSDPTVQASDNTQFITDVWTEVGSSNLGAYELPCNFPVLQSDSVHFVIQAGVWQTGQPNAPVPYPLMQPDIFTIYAKPGEVYTHVPHFSYKSGTVRTFLEDFQGAGHDFDSITICRDTNARYGGACGVITVTASDSSVTATQVAGSNPFPYPLTVGDEVWLELDYKCDVPFYVGINCIFNNGSTTPVAPLFVLPSSKWNKLYVKFSEIVGQEQANSYAVFFQAVNISGNAGGHVYLDNIKLLHLTI